MSKRTPTILFIEDETSLLEEFAKVLDRRGYRVLAASRPSDALRIIREEKHIDLAVTDLQLPMDGCAEIGLHEAAGGKQAGLVLARELRKKFKKTPVVFWSFSFDRDLRTKVAEMGNAFLVGKASGPEPVLDIIADALEGFRSGTRPLTFIVHGHDEATKESVKDYLRKQLMFPDPVVLRDMPSHGKTIIEKLESYSPRIDLVFVLLTPDDKVVSSGGSAEVSRSRQNVIFELGYFMGVLGRNTGRVILLYRRPVELPSDIGGMVNIDITDGIQSADKAIRQELREWV